MIYWIWVVFKGMGPFKIITLDDMWDQMNRSFMYVLCITFAYMIDFSLIAGSAIKCVGFEESFKSTEFVEDYCWTQGIYTLAQAYDQETSSLPYPGIIPEEVPPCLPSVRYDGVRVDCPDQHGYEPFTRVYHLWYQFVQLYFWLTSIVFYMPYMISIVLDVGYVKPLIKMLANSLTPSHEEFDHLLDKAARSLRLRFDTYTCNRNWYNILYHRNSLLFTLLFTKFLYLFYSVGTMAMTDRMFKIGSFLTYGFDWVGSSVPNGSVSTLPQDKLFPKMAACEISRWGTSGIESARGMCVLTQNVSNSYIFLVFWGFLVLAIVGNVIGILVTLMRFLFLPAGYHKLVSLTFYNDMEMRRLYWEVGSSGRIILHQLAENLHPNTFEKLIRRYWWLKKHEAVEYNGHLKTQ